jgi:hypothetical protein
MCGLSKIAKIGRLTVCLKNIALMFKLFLKEEMKMVDMYVALIIAGRRTLEQVPPTFRSQVETDLTALGLDGNGDPIEITAYR